MDLQVLSLCFFDLSGKRSFLSAGAVYYENIVAAVGIFDEFSRVDAGESRVHRGQTVMDMVYAHESLSVL